MATEISQLSTTKRALLQIRELKQRVRELDSERHEPIAIVALGCRFPPNAASPEAFWNLLASGTDAVAPVPADRWDNDAWYDENLQAPDRLYTREAAFLDQVDQFDPAFFGISPREAERMDPQQRLLLEVAWEALERAGWPIDRSSDRTGVFVGSMWNEYSGSSVGLGRDLDAYVATGAAGSFLSGRLSYQLGLRGPSLPIDTACSSSLVAVHLACQSLRRRECDRALAGGVNVMVSPEISVLLCRLQALAPGGRSKAFDASADGYGRGEGCGLVALRRLSDARRDGDPILAVIYGSACNHNGAGSGMTVPNAAAQRDVVLAALQDARVAPHEIGYVEAHGTGTRLGDPIELRALWAALKAGRDSTHPPLIVSTVKTNIGHLEGAAGIAGLIKTTLCLQHAAIPPHLHLHELNPDIAADNLPIVIPRTLHPWPAPAQRPRYAGVSSFGLSGINCHLIVGSAPLEEAPGAAHTALPSSAGSDTGSRPVDAATDDLSPQLLVLSARSEPALRALAAAYCDFLQATPDVPFAEICYSAGTGRQQFKHRLAAVADSSAQAQERLGAYLRREAGDGLLCGDASRGGLAFVFPGQGSQFPGMGRRLYESQPVVRRVLDQCERIFRQLRGESLLDLLWSEDPGRRRQLNQTEWTQPALFAVEVALAEFWLSCGLEPGIVAGHSVGQYAAACIAGIFDVETGLRLISKRGQLMQALPGGGGMVAVFAPAPAVEAEVALRPRLSIAAFNGGHAVVSGSEPELASLTRTFESRKVRCVRLNTSHAFHSVLVEPMLDEFERYASEFEFQEPRRNLVCNLTGQSLTPGQVCDAAYWRRHIRHAVQWERTVASLQAAECGLLLEVGPQAILGNMTATAWTGSRKLKTAVSLRPGRDEWQTVTAAAAEIYVAGQPLDFSGMHAGRTRRKQTLPTYPFQRQRYWKPQMQPLPADRNGRPEPAETSIDSLFYEIAWRLRPRRAIPADFPLSLEEIVCRATGAFEATADLALLRRYPDAIQDLHRLCQAYVLRVLHKFGVTRNAAGFSARQLADAWQVPGDYRRRLLNRLLEVLCEGGQLRSVEAPAGRGHDLTGVDAAWSLTSATDPLAAANGDADAYAAELLGRHEFARVEIELVRRCGARLGEVLSGQTDPMTLLFPRQEEVGAEDYYHHSVGSQAANELVRAVVAQVLDGLPEGRLLRVLEVGAGTGGTTAGLLPLFPSQRTEFDFTDVSAGFFHAAARRFSAFPFVRFRQLDIEHSPEEQKFLLHSYDLVLAANVLHATADIEAAVRHAGGLLAPGGLLVVLEATSREAWLDITFGMLEGWWQFHDSIRSHPFASVEDWLSVLRQNGFDDVAVLRPLGSTRQAVLVARAASKPSHSSSPEEERRASEVMLLAESGSAIADRLAGRLMRRGTSCRITQDPSQALAASRVVDLTGFSLPAADEDPSLTKAQTHLSNVVNFLRAVEQQAVKLRLWRVTRSAQALSDADTVDPVQSLLWGFDRAASLEFPETWGGTVDLPVVPDDADLDALADAVLEAETEDQFTVRGGQQYVARLVPAASSARADLLTPRAGAAKDFGGPIPIHRDATYVITGGLGQLGLETARWLADGGAQTLVLLSRRGLAEVPNNGDVPAAEHAHRQQAAVAALRERGVDVRIVPVDVSDFDQLSTAWRQFESLPAVKGVIHAAGTNDLCRVTELTTERLALAWAGKAVGAWNLHQLTRSAALDFFVCYSSAAAIWGGGGQSHYAAANAYLDGLIQWRRSHELPGLSVNWARWPIGLPSPEQHEWLEQLGLRTFTCDQGLAALGRLIVSGRAQSVVANVDWPRFKSVYGSRRRRLLLDEIVPAARVTDVVAAQSMAAIGTELRSLEPQEREERMTEYVRQVVAQILHLSERPDPNVGFFDLGFDSLMAVELRNRLQEELGLSEPLTSTIAFDYPTIVDLSAELSRLIAAEPGGGERSIAAPTGRSPTAVRDTDREPGIASETIAIVGLACRLPGAANAAQFWQLLEGGVDAIRPIPADRRRDWGSGADSYPTQAGFLDAIDQFDPLFFNISPREAVAIDPQHRLLLEVAWEALEDANIPPSSLRGSPVGVFVGITSTEYGYLLRSSADDIGMHAVTGAPLNAAAGRVAFTFGFVGPAVAIDTACSSSLTAVHQACRSLQAGDCDLALAGGVNLIISPDSMLAYQQAGLLAPDGRSKAFDDAADGFGRGEGCGLVVLQRLADAERNGSDILAVIRGSAVNQDGASSGLTVPNGPAQERVIRAALARAAIAPADVDYLETHGTGTRLGDPIEVHAAAKALGADRPAERPLHLGALKSNIGHLESAAGVAGLIKTVLAMQHGLIPRTLHFQKPNRQVNWEALPVRVVAESTPWPEKERRIAGVSAFGVSGTNAHVIIESWPRSSALSPEPADNRLSPWRLLLLSAKSDDALRQLARDYCDWLSEHNSVAMNDVCFTSAVCRVHLLYRAALPVCSRTDAIERLSAIAQDGVDSTNVASAIGVTPELLVAAERFMDGESVDFPRLYDAASRRVKLPHYPFQRQRCWVRSKPKAALSGDVEQELLGVRQELADGGVVFTSTLSAETQPWIVDHQLYQTIALPGATHVALAMLMAGCPVRLYDVLFREPVLLDSGESVMLQARLDVPGGSKRHTFSIHSRRPEDRDWTLHAAGSLTTGRPVDQSPASSRWESVLSLQDRLEPLDVEQFFQTYADLDLNLGPALRGICRLWIGEGQALAEIVVPEVLETSGEPMHPAVLDACTQAAGAALWKLDAGEVFFAPLQYGEMWLNGPAPRRFFCSVRLRSPISPTVETCSFDLRFQDDAGVVIGGINAFTLKRAPRHAFLRGRSRRWEDWLYEQQWREQPRRSARLPAEFWPPPDELLSKMDGEIVELVQSAGLGDRDLELWRALDRFSRRCIEKAWRELVGHPAPGDLILVEEWMQSARVLASHRRLVRRLFSVLAEQGVIASEGDRWRVLIEFQPPTGDGFEQDNQVLQGRIEAAILSRCGEQLAGVLTGTVDPLSLLFPPDGASAEALYRDSPVLRLFNDIVARTVETLLKPLPPDCRLRVLEIGAGTGATTARMLPLLPPDRTSYTFTDRSLGFLAAAAEQFREFPFVDYRVLDLERAPDAQGFGSDAFDLIIASNVLHATRDIDESLRHVGQLLAPGGLLLLSEVTKPQAWLDLTFGLLDGWWRFDDAVRVDSALLTAAQWSASLQGHGFADPLILAPHGQDAQAVIVTRGPETPDTAATPSGDWLIVSENEAVVEPLVRQLEAAGQRCTVIAQVAGRGPRFEEAFSGQPLQGVVYWPGPGSGDGCRIGLELVKSLIRSGNVPAQGLWFVTRNGEHVFAADDPELTGCDSAAVLGLAHVVAAEHPELNCRSTDIDGSEASIAALAGELLQPSEENRLALRAGTEGHDARRLVARLVRRSRRRLSLPDDSDCRLSRGKSPSPAALFLQPIPAEELPLPARGMVQVEIHAAGLNFRDVLNVLGLYPGEAGPLGGEFSGRIIEVGPDVVGLRAGDEVFGLAAGVMATRANVDARMLVHRPAALSRTVAAGIPIVFVTAALAFERAKVKAGDRVLVHAASGGVGMAAIQLARSIGAEVFATASQPKQEFLRTIGVHRVYDSRSTAFADALLADTGGDGVDVVLNSLTGPGFIEASLRALANGGRFVEIGKRGIWSEARMGKERPDVDYHVLAVDQLMHRTPDQIGSTLLALARRFENRELAPPLTAAYPLCEAADAISLMQVAGHIGKLVLTMPPVVAGRWRLPGTVLITGGLGGLGLATAEWLVESGARSLVLNGRRLPDAAAAALLERLRSRGADIQVVTGDIAEKETVVTILQQIEQEMPALAGVIHAAGVLHDAALLNQDWESFQDVLRPKVQGAKHLHRLTRDLPVELFVMYSSAASLLGNAGQANHAAANMVLDRLAHERRRLGLPAMSVNWGPWSQIGAAARQDAQLESRLSSRGVGWIDPLSGIQALQFLLTQGDTQAGVVPIDWNVAAGHLSGGKPAPWMYELLPQQTRTDDDDRLIRRLLEVAESERPGVLAEHVAAEVQRSLRLDQPPPHDQRFADLGIDSLMSVELRNRLQTQLGPDCQLPSTLAFDFPTVQELAGHLELHVANLWEGLRTRYGTKRQLPEDDLAEGSSVPDASRSVEVSGSPAAAGYPIAAEQRALSFAGLPLSLPVYNIPFRLDLSFRLDRVVLSSAFRGLLQRHEMLRTRFPPGSQRQIVESETIATMNVTDLSRLPVCEQPPALEAVIEEEVATAFDVAIAPLIRLHAVRLGPEQFSLLIILHHLLADGPSIRIITGELITAYLSGIGIIERNAESSTIEQAGPAPVPVPFGQYAEEQAHRMTATEVDEAQRFWTEQLQELAEFPLEAVHEVPSPGAAGFTPIRIECELVEAFEEFCARHDLTLYMGLLGAVQILFCRRFGIEDLAIRTSEARRPPGFEETVGPFMRTLIFRNRCRASQTTTDFLQSVRDQTVCVYRHDRVPLQCALEAMPDELVAQIRRSVQVTLNFQGTINASESLSGLRVEDLRRYRGSSEYAFVFDLTRRDGALTGHLAWRRQFLDEGMAGKLVNCLQDVVRNVPRHANNPVGEVRIEQ